MKEERKALNVERSTFNLQRSTLFGYFIAAVCLIWIFHDVKLGELIGSMAAINWWWVAGAIAFDTLSYVCQGMRWSLLLHPLGRISTFRATQAIYAGLFVNEILPMRLGEILRIYLVSRWTAARFAAVVPSILVERFFDIIWLALAFGITVFAVPLPHYLVDAEEILGGAALGAAVLFIYLVFRRSRPPDGTSRDMPEPGGPVGPPGGTSRDTPEPGGPVGPPGPTGLLFSEQGGAGRLRRWRPIRWFLGLLDRIADGIRDIGRSRFFYAGFGASLFLLLGQILAFWFVMLACGLRLSFWHGAAVFLIVHIGTAIPSAPSNVGTYQFFTVIGLTLFGVSKTVATSFSLVVFFVLTIPLWAIGLLVFARLKLSLKEMRKISLNVER